ncbi:MAG: ABC transporter permease [Chitinophagales bacterium]|jgi:ABC-2 type transport system permease protein|nr:ABC transporter permease [Chitinophagales bacterium]
MNFYHIFLILRREVLAKITNKTFLLVTFLFPIGIILFYAALYLFGMYDSDTFKVGYEPKLNAVVQTSSDKAQFILDSTLKRENADIWIKFDTTSYQTHIIHDKKIQMDTKKYLIKWIKDIYISDLVFKLKNNNDILAQINNTNNFEFSKKDGSKENQIKDTISYFFGFLMGFMMYMMLSLYGTQVMRSVMEEKISKVAETLLSSIKPIELMIGKILSIVIVALIQILFWIFLMIIINIVAMSFMSTGLDTATLMSKVPQANPELISQMTNSLSEMPWLLSISMFLVYFILGYLIYSALFAMIGSVVNEDTQEAQKFIFPVMLPILFAFIILTKTINKPSDPLSVFGSMFPLTSSVIMPARIIASIGAAVPLWQIALSLLFQIVAAFGFLWIAARVYKINIMSSGAPLGFKKWFSLLLQDR